MFKRLFDALRRKHEGNVASPKDAGNVSVSKEEFTPLKFEKTDEKVELAKEPVGEVQETSVATGVSQTEVQSASVAIRPDFKFSSVIIPNNSFEKYTLHAFDVNYALYAEASDKPEEFVKDVEDKVHELYDIHCAFGRLFNVMKNHNTQVSVGESDTMSMYVVAALQCRNGKRYAQALDKLKEGISGEGYFSNSVCSVAVSVLCASGDLSDAYLLLQYLVLYCPEEISSIFFRRYAQLIMSVEELAKTDIEDLVVSYMQNSSKKSFFIKNTYVPILNVPIGAGIFKSDVEYLKSAAPEEYEHYAIDAEKKCNESSERVFETLLDKLHGGTDAEGVWENDRKQDEQKAILQKKEFRFSDVITPENDFEAYTLHAFDVNYAQFANPSDEQEKYVKNVEHQLHELYKVHCAFDQLFDVIKTPGIEVNITIGNKWFPIEGQSEAVQKQIIAVAVSYAKKKLYAEALSVFSESITIEKYFTNDICLIIMTILYAAGDISDAVLFLQYITCFHKETVTGGFVEHYVKLITAVEKLSKTSIEELMYDHIKNISNSSSYIDNTHVPTVNVPLGMGIYKEEIDEIKQVPHYLQKYLLNPNIRCKETTETVFETLLHRIHRNVVSDKNTENEYKVRKTSDALSESNSKDMKSVDEAVKTTEKNIKFIAENGFEVDIFAQRIEYLVNELHVAPEKIVCITATNADAEEVRDRIRHIPESTHTHICTLKKLGYEIIKEEIDILEWSKNFRLINENEQIELLEQIARKVNCSKSNFQMQAEIKEYKTNISQYVTYLQKWKCYEENNESVVKTYLAFQRELEVFDFDDLIEIPRHFISNYPSVAEHWKNAYNYYVIDENQETQNEHDLIHALTQNASSTLTICKNEGRGENNSSQIIYINNWSSDFIKEAAKRPDKIEQIYGTVPEEVAEFVAKSIHGWWEAYYEPGEYELDYNNIAVIYRDEKLIAPFTKVFKERKIPFSKIKYESLLETPEVKLILLLMSVIVRENLYDYQTLIKEFTTNVSENAIISIMKENKRSEGYIIDIIEEKLSVCLTEEEKNFLNEIKKFKEEIDYVKPYAIIELLISRLNLTERLFDEKDKNEVMGNLKILLEKINEEKSFNSNKERILHFLNDVNFITCSTYSRQKEYYGVHFVQACDVKWVASMMYLGFRFAYIIGLNEGVFPEKSAKSIKEIDYERYLLYIAIKRCHQELYLCSSAYNFTGEKLEPSRFLQEC